MQFHAAVPRCSSTLPDDLRPVMRFAYCTGWRVQSEVLPLTWRDVDLDAGVVRLEPETTKNAEGRAFPFDALPARAALLREQRARTAALERATGAIVAEADLREGVAKLATLAPRPPANKAG